MKWPRCGSTWDFRSAIFGSRQCISETADRMNRMYLGIVKINQNNQTSGMVGYPQQKIGKIGLPWSVGTPFLTPF